MFEPARKLEQKINKLKSNIQTLGLIFTQTAQPEPKKVDESDFDADSNSDDKSQEDK